MADATGAVRFIDQLEAGAFEMTICTTGAGLAFLRDLLTLHMSMERIAAALRRVTIVSHGPKPIAVLRAMGVPVQIMIPEPNTWREIVDAVSARLSGS